MAVEGVVVGRPKSRFTVHIPILSNCSSSDFDSVQDSQLLRRLGIMHVSYKVSNTVDSIPLMMSEDAVVLICLTIACTPFSLISRFLLFLLSFVWYWYWYLYELVFLIILGPNSHSSGTLIFFPICIIGHI